MKNVIAKKVIIQILNTPSLSLASLTIFHINLVFLVLSPTACGLVSFNNNFIPKLTIIINKPCIINTV